MDRQKTRYAKSGTVHVAYQVLGAGPGDLVYVQGAFGSLDVMWDLPAFRRFCEQLASFTRLIWFDKRGMGLSDRVRRYAWTRLLSVMVRPSGHVLSWLGSRGAAGSGGSHDLGAIAWRDLR